MDELKLKVQEIFDNSDGGNSLVVSEMHYLLNNGEFVKARKIMEKELYISKEDAKILIAYYKKKLEAKVKFTEISPSEVVVGDYEDIGSKEYLFVYGQSVHQSKAIKNYRDSKIELQFYAQKEFVNISKARQIFLIEWDYWYQRKNNL